MMHFPINEELITATILWCQKRLSDEHEAEELAQDILCEALTAIRRGTEIRAFYLWFWRLADNRLRIFLRLKYNGAASLDGHSELTSGDDVSEPILKAEEISELNLAISRLSALHREIIICHYLREMSVGEIAAHLEVPEGTVKRRLHDARQDIKRSVETMQTVGRSSYAPADLQLWGSYGIPNHWNSINDLMTKQIFAATAFSPRTIREIANEIGVAPVYFEEKLKYLIDNRFLKETSKGKYLADFIIIPRQLNMDFHFELSKIIDGLSDELTACIAGVEPELRGLDFYGNDFSHEYLLWLWYVYACSVLSNEMRTIFRSQRHPDVPNGNGKDYRLMGSLMCPDEKLIPRPIPSVNWSNMHYHFVTSEYAQVTFANLYQAEPFTDRDHMINESNIALVMKLLKTPDMTHTKVEETLAAQLIADGFAEMRDGGIFLTMPVLSYSVKSQIEEIFRRAIGGLALKYVPAISDLGDRMLLPHIRADLKEEYVNYAMELAFYPLPYVMHHAQHTPTLAIPKDYARSAAGTAIYYR